MTATTPSAWRSPRAALAAVAVLGVIATSVYWARAGSDETMAATVSRGELTARLTSSGTLKPMQSITYRSPIPGRDVLRTGHRFPTSFSSGRDGRRVDCKES